MKEKEQYRLMVVFKTNSKTDGVAFFDQPYQKEDREFFKLEEYKYYWLNNRPGRCALVKEGTEEKFRSWLERKR